MYAICFIYNRTGSLLEQHIITRQEKMVARLLEIFDHEIGEQIKDQVTWNDKVDWFENRHPDADLEHFICRDISSGQYKVNGEWGLALIEEDVLLHGISCERKYSYIMECIHTNTYSASAPTSKRLVFKVF